MPKAVELLREGRHGELWQMCCGFLSLNLDEFMGVQKRLLQEQLKLLNNCALGEKIMRGVKPETMEEFRRQAPLTTYADYCPELLEKSEDILPVKPACWVHTSGMSGDYPCKWIPLTPEYYRELSEVSYGIGIFSTCKEWGDVSQMKEILKIVYAVAPRPYMSGTMASMLELQSPTEFMPPLETAESMSFEERIKLGFKQALNRDFDYFFGLSLVLVAVGNQFSQASNKVAVLPLLSQPRALLRLIKAVVRSKLAKRPILPRDLWDLKGIISGGLDSTVYKEKIRELWGKYPLELYGGTEIGIVAAQTWDYDGMTFIPSLNLLEFIPEEENFKWQLDHSYQPKTLLLDEVEAGKNYEIAVTSFHGGAMVRYRPGDMVRITSLRNEKLGIDIPQMVFERRADGLLDFVFLRLTEKTIWEAIERTGIPYTDWIAYKKEGASVLQVCLELADGYQASESEVAEAIYQQVTRLEDTDENSLQIRQDFGNYVNFKVEATLLPQGTFANYIASKRAAGADLAHLKPPHINPSDETLTLLVVKPEKARAGAETEEVAA